jgi:two-component system repressor protein LuxO
MPPGTDLDDSTVEGGAPMLATRRIVVVCDDRALRDELGAGLAADGHDVVLCATTDQAVAALQAGDGDPPLLILDLDLLDLTAMDLLDLVLAAPRPPAAIAVFTRGQPPGGVEGVTVFAAPFPLDELRTWCTAARR